MRQLLFFGSILLLFGCEQDALVPCSLEVPSGMLCREYRYFNEDPQGFVEFEYAGDSVITSRIFTSRSELKKTIIEQFENGKTSVVTEQFPDGPSRVQSWHYNELDSLWLIVFGANDSSLEITYQDGKRFRETVKVDGTLDRYVQYRYFEDDGGLYRISEFDSNDSLTFYSNYDYFSNNGNDFIRISRFSAQNDLIGRRLFTFSQQGLIISMENRLADDSVPEEKKYIYDGSGRLMERTHRLFGNTSKSVYLYN